MNPAQVANIMALVRETIALASYHGMGAAVVVSNIAAVEAALLAPQAEPVRPANFDGVIPTAIHGYLRRCSSGGMSKKHVDIVQANVDEAERLGYFKLAIAETMLAATPSAPTAVEPLFGEMIAQHPGLREEIAADAERAAFEAWCDAMPIKPFPMHMAFKAFSAGWQARAAK